MRGAIEGLDGTPPESAPSSYRSLAWRSPLFGLSTAAAFEPAFPMEARTALEEATDRAVCHGNTIAQRRLTVAQAPPGASDAWIRLSMCQRRHSHVPPHTGRHVNFRAAPPGGTRTRDGPKRAAWRGRMKNSRFARRASALLAAVVVIGTAPAAHAFCGCDKPPPPRANVRPFVGQPDQTITLFDDRLVPGHHYTVLFASRDGVKDWSRGKAAAKRDFADGEFRSQLRIALPAGSLGPVQVS